MTAVARHPLLLRVTTQCNSQCAHCAIRDLVEEPDRPVRELIGDMVRGRKEGTNALVFLRGEATAVKSPDTQKLLLLPLVRKAAGLGYRRITLQTNGRLLAHRKYLEKLIGAGVTDFEVTVFGDTDAPHDRIDGTDGAFKAVTQTCFVEKIDDPYAASLRFIRVGGTDAPSRGADASIAALLLHRLVEQAVVGHGHMRRGGELQPSDVDPVLDQHVEFAKHHFGIYDGS